MRVFFYLLVLLLFDAASLCATSERDMELALLKKKVLARNKLPDDLVCLTKRMAQKRLAIEWHLAMEGRTGKDVMSEAELCVKMEDVSRIKRLFEGCNKEEARFLRDAVIEHEPTDAEIDKLIALELTPPMRMGRILCKRWVPLSMLSADRWALLEKLLQGCDVDEATMICSLLTSPDTLKLATLPDRLACLEAIAAAEISPLKRINIIEHWLIAYLPQSLLQAALAAARALPAHEMNKLINNARFEPDPVAYINKGIQVVASEAASASS